MKLSVAVILISSFLVSVVAAIDASHAAAGSIQVTDNVLDHHECETFRRRVTNIYAANGDDVSYNGRRQGLFQLSLDVVSRVYQAIHPNKSCTCTGGGSANNNGKNTVPVVTSLITKTTAIHQDHHIDGTLAAEQVGFVFLNDNPNASFHYGDDKEQVSVQKGKLVTFQGNVPHHTVVHSGQVHLLGPFAMSSFHPVGGAICADCPNCSTCSDGFICTCMDDDDNDDDECNHNHCDQDNTDYNYHYDYGLSSKSSKASNNDGLVLCRFTTGGETSFCPSDGNSCGACCDCGPFTCECMSPMSSKSSKSSKRNRNLVGEYKSLSSSSSSKGSNGIQCGGGGC